MKLHKQAWRPLLALMLGLTSLLPGGGQADETVSGAINQLQFGVQQCVAINCVQILNMTEIANLTVIDNHPTTIMMEVQNGVPFPASGSAYVAATNLNFGRVTHRKVMNVVLQNTGRLPLVIWAIGFSGRTPEDFDLRTLGDCGVVPPSPFHPLQHFNVVHPHQACTVAVSFNPTVEGDRDAVLAFQTSAFDSPHKVNVAGIGVKPVITPDSLNFGNVAVRTSADRIVKIDNPATDPLVVGPPAIKNAADVSVKANTCGASLPGGQSCNITLSMAPKKAGPLAANATVEISHNGVGKLAVVPLVGIGIVVPVASLAPAGLDFGSLKVGAPATAKDFTLSNVGTAPLTVGAMNITGPASADYSLLANTCPSSLLPDQSCAIHVQFKPLSPLKRDASLSISDNAAGSPHGGTLTGVGLQPGLSINPAAVTFGNVSLGGSASKTVTLTNSGNSPLTISSTSIPTADAAFFSRTPACQGALDPGASCTTTITFNATPRGVHSTTLAVLSDAPGGPASVPVSGRALGVPVVSLSPAAGLDFGQRTVSTTSPGKKVSLKNTGTDTLNMSSLALTGDSPSEFSASGSTCPASLEPGQGCSVMIAFKPTGLGLRTAAMSVTSNAAPASLGIRGTGIRATGAVAGTTARRRTPGMPRTGWQSDVASLSKVALPNDQVGIPDQGRLFGAGGALAAACLAYRLPPSGDLPYPIWALVLLCLGLLTISLIRAGRRRRL